MRSNVGGCSVSLSLNLNLNINLSLSVAPDASGGPCSNTCCGRSYCGIGSYSYSSSRNGGCSSNDSVLCVRVCVCVRALWVCEIRRPCVQRTFHHCSSVQACVSRWCSTGMTQATARSVQPGGSHRVSTAALLSLQCLALLTTAAALQGMYPYVVCVCLCVSATDRKLLLLHDMSKCE